MHAHAHQSTCLSSMQTKEDLSDVQWREDEVHAVVSQLHDDVLGLVSAHGALRQFLKDKSGELPGKLVKMLGATGIFDRETLINLYRPHGAPLSLTASYQPACLLACLLTVSYACLLACLPACLPAYCVCAYLLARLLACLLACLPACLLVCLLACLLAHLPAC